MKRPTHQLIVRAALGDEEFVCFEARYCSRMTTAIDTTGALIVRDAHNDDCDVFASGFWTRASVRDLSNPDETPTIPPPPDPAVN